MYDYYPHWKKKVTEKPTVRQIDVRQKNRITIRLDDELYSEVKSLAKELNQDESKVIRDILNDFFLDREIIENKKDVEHLLSNT